MWQITDICRRRQMEGNGFKPRPRPYAERKLGVKTPLSRLWAGGLDRPDTIGQVRAYPLCGYNLIEKISFCLFLPKKHGLIVELELCISCTREPYEMRKVDRRNVMNAEKGKLFSLPESWHIAVNHWGGDSQKSFPFLFSALATTTSKEGVSLTSD